MKDVAGSGCSVTSRVSAFACEVSITTGSTTPDKLGNGLVRWIPRKGEKWGEKQVGKKVNRENKKKTG